MQFILTYLIQDVVVHRKLIHYDAFGDLEKAICYLAIGLKQMKMMAATLSSEYLI